MAKEPITPENLRFLLTFLKNVMTSVTTAKQPQILPTGENSAKLSLLNDLKELIAPAKNEDLYDQDAIEELLRNEYRKKTKAGNCSWFFSLRTILEEEQYANHFRALLAETPTIEV